ncbi:centrosomal protein of 85 kDa-like isoform X2 [Patiria miniata]|uniref:Centrosomal protein of 85 kDa-like CC4 coiled-coil domain-containing protein n=1 Tax=Patiria miniata TaxID=46514 RepID=A0A914BQF1_PATMI|nr:centrosomal protein of 85 kDa-like isoform X2 [Patiria miniata]
MEDFYHYKTSSEGRSLPRKYLNPSCFGLEDLDSSGSSLERSLSPLSFCSGVSDFDSNCSYLDSGLDLTGTCSSSALHEARSLPVAQVTPSKAESPPRKSSHNPPSTLDIRSAYQPYHSDYGSLPSSHSHHDSMADEEFVPLDATFNQSRIVADTEPAKHKWSSEQNLHYDAKPTLHKAMSPSSYGTGVLHKRSPVKPDLYTSSAYSSYTPAGDLHVPVGMGLHGKTSMDYLDKPGFGSTYGTGLKSHDLMHWQQQLQQQQQQQQLQQQLERLQLSQTGLQSTHPYSGSYSSTFGTLPGGSHFGQDLGKLEGVIRAKENLLEEKNLVIERQKLELAHSQEQLRHKQAQERQFMYTRVQEDKGDFLLMKVQEYQYENATLKAQLAEHSSIRAAEIETLNKKLGETEYEHEKLKKALKEANESKVKELKELERKMSQKEESDEGTKVKYNRMKEKYDKLKKRVSSLERYMGDLPTAEQHLKNTEVIKNLCEKEKLLKERISQLEASLAESRNTVRSRDITVSKLEGREADLMIELDSLRSEASRLQSALGAPRDTDPTSLKLFSRTAMEELVQERDEAKAEAEKYRKMVESKHKQLKAQQTQHQKALAALEERLQQEEDSITALRETNRSKDADLRKMKDSMTALAKQSQELYEHNLDVQERNQALEKIASSDVIQSSHRLIKELGECVAELHGLVQVCTQTAEGQEPNVSVLLRFRTPSVSNPEPEGAEGGHLSSDTLHAKLKQVKDLRAEIDRLRSVVSNKYAEDMGNECITQ